jgi:hypothetical protein
VNSLAYVRIRQIDARQVGAKARGVSLAKRGNGKAKAEHCAQQERGDSLV